MNPASFLIVLGSGILIGGALGWTLKSPAKDSPQPAEKAISDQRADKGPRKEPAPNRAVQAEAKRLQDASINPTTLKYEDWSSEDLKSLVASLLEQSDPVEGMDFQKREFLARILLSMARKDRDGTLAWIDATFPAQRYIFYSRIIEELMQDVSPRDRVEFLKSRNFGPNEIGAFAGMLLFQGGHLYKGTDTETAIYLFTNINPSEGGMSGGNCQFTPDFDFGKVAAALIAKAKADGNRPPSSFPMNFLQEWARTSPQDASDFYFSHCTGKDALKLHSNGIEQLLGGVKSSIRESDYTSWLGQTLWQQFQAASPDQESINRMVYSEIGNPAALSAALNEIQDPEIKSKLLYDTLSACAESSVNGDGLNLRNSLSLYTDPAERLQRVAGFAGEIGRRNGDRDKDRLIDGLCSQLANLGHSEAEVRSIRAAANP